MPDGGHLSSDGRLGPIPRGDFASDVRLDLQSLVHVGVCVHELVLVLVLVLVLDLRCCTSKGRPL